MMIYAFFQIANTYYNSYHGYGDIFVLSRSLRKQDILALIIVKKQDNESKTLSADTLLDILDLDDNISAGGIWIRSIGQ